VGAVKAVDGVLMDLGISSPQIDDPARGFSFRRDGPLDMRMDTSKGITAAEFLETATAAQIREVIKNYGEERFAVQIAQAIVARRTEGGSPLATTGELAALVADVLRQRRAKPEPGQDPATRTFQALRIYINQELEELQTGLEAAMDALRVGGRLSVISFHSLEDRMVKQAMRARAHPPEPPKGVPLRVSELPVAGFKVIGKAQRPSAEEVAGNPRARSAILRVLERVAA
jgi:16S rRNA (cytosine1402-N4)-methyltransferase